MAAPLLTLQDMRLTFGTTPLLTGADLMVSKGERLCLVGRNGSGKSTLLKIAAGLAEADSGKRFKDPGASLRYLPQEADFTGFDTVLAYVEAGLGPADDHYRAAYLLTALGLSGEQDPQHLSGGESRRAALARVLAPEPDILLLDEPTNHLDLPAILWLENELKSMRSALVLISHDRRFLETLSKSTIWLDRGLTRRLDKGFARFEAWRDELLQREADESHKLDRKIAAEEDWIRYGVTGRRKRNVRRVAELAALRQQRREAWKVEGSVNFQASPAEVSGKLVVEAKGLSKSFDGKPVVVDFSTRIGRGDRIGIIGRNGSGKTTLLRLLTGELQSDAGSVRRGAALEMVTLAQRRDELLPSATLREALTGGRGDHVEVGGRRRHVMGYMKDFLFAPEQARTPLGVLSGGERGRLMLARALAKPSNLLVLDEPTNDLDLETLDLLQELLAGYEGTVILVSHDRDFLDRVVTSVIAFEGDGHWQEYAGGYSDMLVQRAAGSASVAVDANANANADEAGSGGNKSSRGRSGRARKDKSARQSARASQLSQASQDNGGKPAAADRDQAALRTRRKLTFKDQHMLKALPATIERLQGEIAALQSKLEASEFYGRDPDAFAATADALRKAEISLATAEDDWLRLELLREELEGG